MNNALASRTDFDDPRLAIRHDLASLRQELRHEVRLSKLDTDHRCTMLELKLDNLQRQLDHETTTQRQGLLTLVGAMVVFAFCMLVALAPG